MEGKRTGGAEELLGAFVRSWRSGEMPDVRDCLASAQSSEDRRLLAEYLEGFLEWAPSPGRDPERLARWRGEAFAQSLIRSLEGKAGLWPVLLPRLRHRAGMSRRELVGRLAKALDLGDHTEKVGIRYHEMEQGLLPARGVSQRVLDVLAKILGADATRLRRAGEALPTGEGPAPTPAFGRAKTGAGQDAESPAVAGGTPATADSPDPDEVDRLFTSS